MKRKTLLVLCSGLGLGNSTRLLGVVQAIRRRFKVPPDELRVIVCTNGRAVEFWKRNGPAVFAEVLPLAPYPLRVGAEESGIRWLAFLRPTSAWTYWINTWRIFSFLKADRADLALIDSDYHCLPLLLFRLPIIALGQAWDVLRRFELSGPRSPIPRSSMLIERLDFFFQRLVSRIILVPSFGPVGPMTSRLETVPLIVRQEFTLPQRKTHGGRIHVLLSGSGIGAEPLLAYARRYGLPVIGGNEDPSSALDARGTPCIDESQVVLLQGGLSSISECLARGKKMIILPMEKHGEQLANALEVERCGQGILVSKLAPLPELVARLEQVTGKPSRDNPTPRTNGAEVVAERLLQALGPLLSD